MSTNSFSVIADIQSAFERNMNVNPDSINVSGHRMELDYDGNDYDITVTKTVPYCGEQMDFGQAIRCLKKGLKVAREGWNGKGMFLWLKPATVVKSEMCHDPKLKALVDKNGGEILGLGTICMYTHDSTGRKAILTGWLASQSDMLYEDWVVVA